MRLAKSLVGDLLLSSRTTAGSLGEDALKGGEDIRSVENRSTQCDFVVRYHGTDSGMSQVDCQYEVLEVVAIVHSNFERQSDGYDTYAMMMSP